MSKTFDKMQKSLGIEGQEIAVELKIDKRNFFIFRNILQLKLNSTRLGSQSINDVYFVRYNPFKLCTADVIVQMRDNKSCCSQENMLRKVLA